MDSPRSPEISEPIPIDSVPIKPVPIEPSHTSIASSLMPSSPSSVLVTVSTVAPVLGKRIDESEDSFPQNGSIDQTMSQLCSNASGDAVISGNVSGTMVMPKIPFIKMEPEESRCVPLLPKTMLSIVKMPSVDISPEEMLPEEIPAEGIPAEGILPEGILPEEMRSETLPSTETMPSDPKPSSEAMSLNLKMRSNQSQAKKKSCRNAMQPSTRVQLGLRPNPSKTVTFTEKMPAIKRSNAQSQEKKNICRKKQATMLSTLVPRELPSEPLASEPMPTPVLRTVSIPPYEPILYSPNIYQYAPQVMKNICPMVQATSTVDPRALSSEQMPSELIPSEPMPTPDAILPNSTIHQNAPQSNANICQAKNQTNPSTVTFWRPWEPTMPSTVDPRGLFSEPIPSELMPTPETELPNSTINSNAPQSNANICQAKNPASPSTVTFWRPWEPMLTNPQPKKNIICLKIEATMAPSTVDPRALLSEPIPSEPMPSEPMPTPEAKQPNSTIHPNASNENICQAKNPTSPSTVTFWRPWEPKPTSPPPKKNIICRKIKATMAPSTLDSRALPSEPIPSELMPFEPTTEAILPNSTTIHPNVPQSNANICQAKPSTSQPTVIFWRPCEPTNPPPKKNIICRKKLRQAAMSSTLASGTMLGQTMSSYRYILPKTDRMSMPSTVNRSTTVVIRTMPNGQDSVAQVPECIDLTKEGQPVIGSFRTLIGEQMPLREMSNNGPRMQHQTSRLVLNNKAMPSTTMGIKTPSIKPLGIKPLGIKTINIKTPSIKTKSIKCLDTMHECIWSGCAYKSNHKGNTVKHVRAIHLRLPVTLKKMEQSGMELSDNWSKWIRSSKI